VTAIDSEFDDDDLGGGLFGELFDDDEVRAGGRRVSKFTVHEVRLACRRVDQAGILPNLREWAAEDRRGKHPGGRPSLLTDRAVLACCLLLVSEGTALWLTEMATFFWLRLTDEAREELGIDRISNSGVDERDFQDWYHRVSRRLHRILRLMDAWPMEIDGKSARNKLVNRETREKIISLRDKNESRRKRDRGLVFTNAMIEMTVQAQPRALRRRWKGSLSVDQTAARAASQKGRRKRDKAGLEIPLWNTRTKEEVHKWVIEIDADYYPIKADKPRNRDTAATTSDPDYEWAYSVNLVVQTNENPLEKARHPHLIMAASLSTPNKDIGGEVVRAMESIQQRGHHISRLTSDRGYGPQLKVEDFHIPLKALGIPLVMDYNSNQKGIKGGKSGALQVEGAHYCPATPENLLEASVDADQKLIDHHTYLKRKEELRSYKLRPKEKPDSEGNVRMMCPAYGPNATLECPLKARHPNSSKKSKPNIRDADVPKYPDEICTTASVTFGPEEGVKFEQQPHYGSKEWEDIYKHDRNSIESHNEYIKHGPERLHDPTTRRLRGMAAQQFIVTMLVVSSNLRKVARFLRDEARQTPKKIYPRRRDTEKMSTYVRWRNKIELTDIHPDLWTESGPPLRT
jgi:hypothetical protein